MSNIPAWVYALAYIFAYAVMPCAVIAAYGVIIHDIWKRTRDDD